MYRNIVISGSISIDTILNYSGLFQDLTDSIIKNNLNLSIIADSVERKFGGTGTNITYNFYILQDTGAKLIGCVGKDGHQILEFLASRKIPIDAIQRDENLLTAAGTVITDRENNQFWGFCYAAGEKAKDIELDSIVSAQDLLVIASNHVEAVYSFQNQAIALGIDYMYDVGMIVEKIDLQALKMGVRHCHILIGNQFEMQSIMEKSGFSISELIDSGKTIITTMGHEGVIFERAGLKLRVPAWPANAIDPTGAGDAWRGGFLSGLIQNRVDRSFQIPVDELVGILAKANCLASFAIENIGGIGHDPSMEELDLRYEFIINTMEKPDKP